MTYEIRAMTLGEILDTSFRLLRNHFGPLVGMSAAIYLPYYVVIAWFQTRMQAQVASGGGEAIGGTLVALLASGITFVIVAPIVSAAIYYAISEAYLGRTVQVGASLREALRIVLPLLGTSILATLAMLGLTLLLVVPGVWFFLGIMVLIPINVVERSFGVAAIRRTLELMKGNRGRGFLLYLLFFVVQIVLSGALGLIGYISPWIGAVGQGLTSAVAVVLMSAMSMVLYFDIRCRKEAFDVEHLARLVSSGAAA
jgi:hypothetical protein